MLVALGGLLALLAAAWGGDDGDEDAAGTAAASAASSTTAASTTSTSPEVSGPLIVFAAASLTESFKEMKTAFEADNPGAKITFNFAASSALVTQITQGAPADVYASADETNMKKLTEAGQNSGTPEVFAENQLEMITEPGNPKGIQSLAHLARPGVLLVTCAPEVPIGRYSAEALQKAGVTVTPVSYEADVKAVVTKVTSGEADAGIVYSTDVRAAGSAGTGVKIPEAQNVIAKYPIVVTRSAPNAKAAQAFVDYVTSNDGTRTLERFGFTAP